MAKNNEERCWNCGRVLEHTDKDYCSKECEKGNKKRVKRNKERIG